MNFEKPKPRKPEQEPEPQPCQHVRILDCDKPVRRIFYECYKCYQGLLTECSDVDGQEQDLDVQCPNCGRIAIKLTTGKVLSTTAIPSPWSK